MPSSTKDEQFQRTKTNLEKIFEETEGNKNSPESIKKSLSSAKMIKIEDRNGRSLARYLDKIHTNKVFHLTRVQIIQT